MTILSISVSAIADEHLIITTTAGGQLKDRILDSDFEDLTSLTVQGPINALDWQYLTSNSGIIAGVRTLDLSSANLILDGSVYNTYVYGTGSMGLKDEWEFRFWPTDSIATIKTLDTTIYQVYGNNLSGGFMKTQYEKIILPTTLSGIGERAFLNCKKLKEVVCGGKEIYIGKEAFLNCESLEAMALPVSIDSIGDYAFSMNSKLKSLDLSNVTILGIESFKNSALEEIELADGLRAIPERCFYECYSLKSILIPSSVKTIALGAFYCDSNTGSQLSTIEFQDGLEVIESGSFSHGKMTSIALPRTLKKLGSCFLYCSLLETVDIPDNLLDIDKDAFRDSPYLKNNTDEENGVLYLGPIAFAISSKNFQKNLIIREGTKSIASGIVNTYVRDGWYNEIMTSVTLPSTLLRIGVGAFSSCKALTEITLPEGIEEIGAYAFSNNKIEKLEFPSTLKVIEDEAFKEGCINTVILPESIRFIGNYAFKNNPIKSIVLPKNLEYIGSQAFGNNQYLAKITYNCINLINVRESSLNAPFYNSSCDELIIGDEIESLPDFLFANMKSNIRSINLPSTLRRIGIRAFSGHDSLVTVNLPESLEYIGESAFSNTSIENIALPESLRHIGPGAFGSSSLKELQIPTNIEFIGHGAFGNIKTLEKVSYSAIHAEGGESASLLGVLYPAHPFESSLCSEFDIDDNVEYMMPALLHSTKISTLNVDLSNVPENKYYLGSDFEKVVFSPNMKHIPDNLLRGSEVSEIVLPPMLESIGDSAFYRCTQLRNVELPNSVKYIGKHAFNHANYAFGKRLSLPPSLEYIGDYAFALNNNIFTVFIPESVAYIGEGALTFGHSNSTIGFGGNNNVNVISMTPYLPASNGSPFYNDEIGWKYNKTWNLTVISEEYLEDENWSGFSSVNKLDTLHCDPQNIFSPDFTLLEDIQCYYDIISVDGIYIISAEAAYFWDEEDCFWFCSHTKQDIADNLIGKSIGTHDITNDFHGIYLLLPEGKGKVEVKIDPDYGSIQLLQGNGQKMTVEAGGYGVSSMEYDLTEPTPLYIYRSEQEENPESIINYIKVIPEAAAVETIDSYLNSKVIDRYLLDGRRVMNPAKGTIVIEHLSDGKTRKVIAD